MWEIFKCPLNVPRTHMAMATLPGPGLPLLRQEAGGKGGCHGLVQLCFFPVFPRDSAGKLKLTLRAHFSPKSKRDACASS